MTTLILVIYLKFIIDFFIVVLHSLISLHKSECNDDFSCIVSPGLKAHVYPSGFARLSFCFGTVHLSNAVF